MYWQIIKVRGSILLKYVKYSMAFEICVNYSFVTEAFVQSS